MPPQKNGDHFSSLTKSCKVFSPKRFTRAFSLLFAIYPNLAATTATRPLKRRQAARFLLPPKLFPAIIVPGNLYVCFAYMLKRRYHPYFNNTSAALSASFTAAFCIAFLPEMISAVSAAPAYALSAQTMLLFAVDIILSSTRALEVR